jgi:hypothetical protein
MKKSFYRATPFLLLAIVFTSSCYNDNAELLYGAQATTDCSTVQAKFGADIAPIINSKCAISGCHDANAVNNGADKIFTNYSLIIPHITHIQQRVVIEKTMPPTGPLSAPEIDKIKCWIANGALNN